VSERMRFVRALPGLLFCAALAVLCHSCRLPHGSSLAEPGFTPEATGTDLALVARFCRAEDEAPGFFKTLLPDSAVLPVRVALRNEGSHPLVIPDSNGMALGPGFDGFALVVGGETYSPLSPKRVAEILVGVKKADRYRPIGTARFLAGTLLAPLGGYYIYREVAVGRFYRPLFGNSLYPAVLSGMVEPVRLEPGEERDGYLYFAVPKSRAELAGELLVRACRTIEALDTLGGYDFRVARNDVVTDIERASSASEIGAPEGEAESNGDGAASAAGGSPGGIVFKLERSGPSAASSLCACGLEELMADCRAPWAVLEPSLSRSAEIADASAGGSYAACAINFKSKSRVFVVRRVGGFTLVGGHAFPRRVKRVFATDRAVLVIGVDDFCGALDYQSFRVGRSARLGRDIGEAAIADSSLFVFSRGRRLDLFAASGGALFKPLERHDLYSARREALGRMNGSLLLLHRGAHARGDTLVSFEIARRAETAASALVGKVNRAATDGSSVFVQLEEGTLLRLVASPLGALEIVEAGYLPFMAKELGAARGGGFVAFGPGGVCARGEVGDYSPGARGEFRVSTPVR
jgi:hypothetical protein